MDTVEPDASERVSSVEGFTVLRFGSTGRSLADRR